MVLVVDLVLFLEPEGVEFVQDGTRNELIQAERKKYSEMLKEWFMKNDPAPGTRGSRRCRLLPAALFLK